MTNCSKVKLGLSAGAGRVGRRARGARRRARSAGCRLAGRRRARPGRRRRGRPRRTRAGRARSGRRPRAGSRRAPRRRARPARASAASSGSSQRCHVESPTASRSSLLDALPGVGKSVVGHGRAEQPPPERRSGERVARGAPEGPGGGEHSNGRTAPERASGGPPERARKSRRNFRSRCRASLCTACARRVHNAVDGAAVVSSDRRRPVAAAAAAHAPWSGQTSRSTT